MSKSFIYVALTIAGLFLSRVTIAQSGKEKDVAVAVEQLKKAMLDGDSAALDPLISDQLSYGHSSGHIEDKKSFIHSLSSGESDFETIELSDQTITVVKNTAIVRHILSAATSDHGKSANVKLSVLTIWQKAGGKWKLLARQAVHV